MGHEVIRLPPYHCQYNPIELIWAQIKREVEENNCTFKIRDVMKLLEDAIKNVTIEDWQNCVAHAERLLEEDFAKGGLRGEQIQRILINLRDDSDETSSDDEDSEADARPP